MIQSLALFLAVSFAQGTAQAPQSATYTNEWIGISLTHPSDWKVVPKKADAWITYPVKDGAAFAGLNLMAVTYNADTEIWQFSQKDTNQDMGFEVVRQWQEEILGVPLLMTKVRSGPGKLASAIKAVPELPSDQPLITLIGLVYSRTPRKLLFRLTAPEAAFDDAELALRKTLETLRTSDGNLPQPEDPSRKPDPALPIGSKLEAPPKKTTIGAGGKGTETKFERAPKVFESTVAGQKVGFYFPDGWTVEKSEGDKLILVGLERKVRLNLTLHSTLDSDPPVRALMKATAEGLKAFNKVTLREENSPKANRAGATYIRVWREGEATAGTVWSVEAVGGSPQYYFMVTGGGSGKIDPALRKALDALIDQLSVEPLA